MDTLMSHLCKQMLTVEFILQKQGQKLKAKCQEQILLNNFNKIMFLPHVIKSQLGRKSCTLQKFKESIHDKDHFKLFFNKSKIGRLCKRNELP